MACIAAASTSTAASSFVQKIVVERSAVSRVQGLPVLRRARVVCSAKHEEKAVSKAAAAAAAVSTLAVSHPALALVDERLSTEGVGLALGLSNPALGWILVGVFALIWTAYFAYSASLPEGDDDSGLSL